jgi:hypothetical protein
VEIVCTGLCFFKLYPPDVLNGRTIFRGSWIDAGEDVVAAGMARAEEAAALPAGAFLHWIYLHDWYAFMVIGAMDARMKRLEATDY